MNFLYWGLIVLSQVFCWFSLFSYDSSLLLCHFGFSIYVYTLSSSLNLFKFQLVWTTLPLPAHYTLKDGVPAHQLHCSGIKLVSGSNRCRFCACFCWMCEVSNTGSATTRISISRTSGLEVPAFPLGQLAPIILMAFVLQKNKDQLNEHTWRVLKTLKDSVLPYCFY